MPQEFRNEASMKCSDAAATTALDLMEKALNVLDSSDVVPADIGAHLDLAIERLRAFLDLPRDADDQLVA